jgi:hypothetical protein
MRDGRGTDGHMVTGRAYKSRPYHRGEVVQGWSMWTWGMVIHMRKCIMI